MRFFGQVFFLLVGAEEIYESGKLFYGSFHHFLNELLMLRMRGCCLTTLTLQQALIKINYLRVV